MYETHMHEVDFATYCDRCEHEKCEGFKDPCNSCLEEEYRDGTTIPLNFKENSSSQKKHNP